MELFIVGFVLGFFLGLGTMSMAWWRKREEIRELEALLKTPVKKLVEGKQQWKR